MTLHDTSYPHIYLYNIQLPITVTSRVCCKMKRETDPPCTFPLIILLLDHLSKIWGTTFDQVAKDVESMVTFEKWPLVAELKLKVCQKQQIQCDGLADCCQIHSYYTISANPIYMDPDYTSPLSYCWGYCNLSIPPFWISSNFWHFLKKP